MTYTPAPRRFSAVVLRSAALALILGRRSARSDWPGSRRDRFARLLRYCRARGLRGASSSRLARTMARALAERWAAEDRW